MGPGSAAKRAGSMEKGEEGRNRDPEQGFVSGGGRRNGTVSMDCYLGWVDGNGV